jgi:L-asparaginase / beta-aspartyl-peptidase
MFLKRRFLRLSPQAHCWAIHCIAWAASLVCNATHSFAQSSTVTESKSTALASSTALSTTIQPEWTIAIHGGAGGDLDRWTEAQRQVRIEGLRKALKTGAEMLDGSAKAIDVVEAVVRVLEDDPNFNAGRGAVLNEVGEYSLDASLMDGSDLTCGAVANVRKTRNPISLARAVRDKTPHVFLVGEEADTFGVQLGLPTESGEYFKTQEQIDSWNEWKKRQAAKKEATSRYDHDRGEDRLFYLGTVGCVVLDVHGNLAAATSTGGLLGKKYGRIGDTPIIGAGTFASNQTCAVSCTGVGELFIRNHIASAVSSRMEYLRESLGDAGRYAIDKTLPADSGGLIAVDAQGNIETIYNTPIMARGQANSQGLFRVGLADWVQVP